MKIQLGGLAGLVLMVLMVWLAGYWLGNFPWVKANLSLIIIGIIAFSINILAG